MFTKIMVPLDGSPLAEQAIGPAMSIARAFGAALDLVLVHKPLPFGGFEDAPWRADASKTERAYLETIALELASVGSVPVTSVVLRGEPSEKICERARDVNADLVVMTTHGRTGLSRAWMGSVAHGVLRHTSAPVYLIRPTTANIDRTAYEKLATRILVTLDGSELARGILSPVVQLARCSKGRLVLLRVVEPVPMALIDASLSFGSSAVARDEKATAKLVEDARRYLACVVNSLASEGFTGIEAEVVVADRVAQAILDFARAHEVDSIAMATHGRGVSRLFTGSVADKVLRASGLPMLLQRPLEVQSASLRFDDASIAEQMPALSGL